MLFNNCFRSAVDRGAECRTTGTTADLLREPKGFNKNGREDALST